MILYFNYDPIDVDVSDMTKDEFEEIKNSEDTPQHVHITGTDELWYNSYTCLNGFEGTCMCESHQRKRWDLYSLSEMITPPRRPEPLKPHTHRKTK